MNANDKLKEMGVAKLEDIPEAFVNELYRRYKQEQLKKQQIDLKIDETADACKYILNYINILFKNCGKQPINSFSEFKNIERNDLICTANEQYVLDNRKQIYKDFGKTPACMYSKSHKGRCIGLLKFLLHRVGLGLIKTQKCIEVDTYRKTHIFYSIGNKIL